MTKTLSSSAIPGAYGATSVYQTVINPNMPEEHRDKKKQVASVVVAFPPLVSGQQVVIKYRVDGGSWTTLLTATTVGRTVAEAVYDVTGKKLTPGTEYEFRVESTGGAPITELQYGYEIFATLI
jgi:hypothetical protein